MPVPSDETRQRLLDAAGQTFADKGFKAATVREICSSIQANIAAVNYHFGDKEQLYVEAVKVAHCSREFRPPEWPAGTAPATKLRYFLHHMLSNLLDPNRPEWHGRLMMREMADPTAACAAVVDAFVRPMASHLRDIVCELLPRQTDPIEISLVCFSIVGQCLFHRVHRPIVAQLVGETEHAAYDVERLTDHITRFSLAALGVKAKSPGRPAHAGKGASS